VAHEVVEENQSELRKPLTSALFLVLVLALIAFWSFRGAVGADAIARISRIGRPLLYLRTIVFEWVLLGLVLIGLRLQGSSFQAVLGRRWHSGKEIVRDTGIAAAFWIVSTIVLSMITLHPHDAPPNPLVQAMLPQGFFESVIWIALSITAGICEEAVYRGYLQRQLMAMTKSVTLGIALSALAFAVAHSYKGLSGAFGIFVDGVMLGSLAYWRRSVRPGMIAHAFTDSFAGVIARLLKIGIS
jgi:membrane protease YdiL (CAAX protease family)